MPIEQVNYPEDSFWMVSQALALEKSRVGAFFRAWGNL